MVGRRIGGCRVEALLGGGSVGYVFRAFHLTLEKTVALKILGPRVNRAQDYVRRFMREARICGSIEHPNVIPVYGVGEDTDFPYIIMRFIDGSNLYRVLTREGLDQVLALRLCEQVAMGLGAVHRAGYVHRDVKPENVLISRDGQAFLCDFGVADELGSSASSMSGGSPPYMSPEQMRGDAVDGRSDIYSLGVMLYQLIAGRRPFVSVDSDELQETHTREDAPPLTSLAPGVLPEVASLVHRMLAKRPEDRFESCDELLEHLRKVQDLLRAIRRKRSMGIRLRSERASVGAAATVNAADAIRSKADALDPGEHHVVDDKVEEVEIGLLLDTAALLGPVRYRPSEADVQTNPVDADFPGSADETVVDADLSRQDRRSLRELDALIARRPLDAVLLLTRANLRFASGDVNNAERDYKQVLELDPTFARAMVDYAGYLQHCGRNDEAETQLRHAMDLEPRNVEAVISLGRLYQSYDAIGLARKAFERAIFFAPRDERGYLAMGLLLEHSGNSEGAEPHLKKALELNPSHGSALYWNAVVYARQNKAKMALELLGRAIRSGISPMRENLDHRAFDAIRDTPRFRELVEKFSSRFAESV